MKKLYYFLMQALICVLLTSYANATTVNVTLTKPDTLRTCAANNFTAHFTIPAAAGKHTLFIKDSIYLNCGNVSSCQTEHLAVFHILSSTPVLNDFKWDTTSHVWKLNLDTLSYTITYNVSLDCGTIPWCGDTSSAINMYQIWSDSASTLAFNIDSSGTNKTHQRIFYPYIVEQTSSLFSGNYLDTVPLYHIYKNTGHIQANIVFNFNPSPFNACHIDSLISLKYDIGNADSASVLSYSNNVSSGWANTVTIPAGEALVVRKDVVIKGCIDTTCSHEKDTLAYRCNYSDTAYTFCDTCQHVFDKQYSIIKSDSALITITRLLPDSATVAHDYTCMGTKEQWRYIIKNNGNVNFHYADIKLVSFVDAHGQLLLIDTSDVQIAASLSSISAWHDTKTLMQYALCGDTIHAPLGEMNIYIQNFMKGDSIILSFKTFRCCDEIDSPTVKLEYGNWILRATGTDSCGVSEFLISNYISGNPYWDMKLDYFPIVSDLVVPHGTFFGPSTPLLFVDESSLAAGFASNYQLWGCSGTAATCGMHGFLRVHINCETGLLVDTPLVHLVNFPTDSARTWNPVYHYCTLPPDTCGASDSYFYFDMSDTNAFALIKRGRLAFRLRSCCGDHSPSKYTIDFALLTNSAGTCDSLSFPAGDSLPPVCSFGNCCYMLTGRVNDQINILCPGCLAPGIEVNTYTIQRINLGAKDSDNDGRADNSLAAIDSTYLNTYSTLMRTMFANHGDLIEDHLTGHFQDGDNTHGGYIYQQMLNDTSILHFLQLDRTFTTAGSAQMNLTPYNFKLYVDVQTDSAHAHCVECTEFGVDTIYKTIHIIDVPSANINNYVQYDTASFRLFFTFDATNDSTVHNMYQNVVLHDTLFNGYRAFQRYRMKTDYSVCGYFSPLPGVPLNANDLYQQAQINNSMWLSGKQQPVNAISFVPFMPNDTDNLHLHGWTFDNTDSTKLLVNQLFADSFLFVCAGLGGRFYFYSDETENESSYISVTGNGCQKQIRIHPFVRTGALLSEAITPLYPYEYRLPSFKPYHCKVRIPTGYTADTVATIHSEFKVAGLINNGATATLPRNFIVHPNPADSSIEINLDTLFSIYPIYCLTDSVSIPVTSQNLYSGDNYLSLVILIDLHTLNCNPDSIYAPDTSDLKTQFKDNIASCTDSIVIRCNTLYLDPVTPDPGDTIKVPNPSLTFYPVPPSSTAASHQLCWKFNLVNTVDNAYNVFIAPQQVSYLSNWTIQYDTTLLNAGGNGIFNFSAFLPKGFEIDTAALCATYDSCIGTGALDIYYGWSCQGFPDSISNNLCALDTAHINFTDAGLAPLLTQDNPDTVDLCRNFIISALLTNSGVGSIYPFELQLDSLDSNLTVVSVQLYSSCSVSDTITVPGSPWNITAALLDSIGINEDTTISSGSDGITPTCLNALITLRANCAAVHATGDTIDLPHIHVLAHSYCDSITVIDIQGRVIPPSALAFQAIYSGISHCNDCFTLQKIAIQNTVSAGDTIPAFNIIICGNNDSSYVVSLTEFYPNGFHAIPSIPATDTVPAQGCDTITVFGYFDSTGTCSSLVNTVQLITTSHDTLYADTCITVVEPCALLADTIIPNGTFSVLYGSGLNGITILIEDTFFVNNYFTLTNCTVYVASGGTIILVPTVGTLVIDSSTTITGCTDMWRGIEEMPDTKLSIVNQSVIRDAEKGIYAHNKSGFVVSNSSILDCVKGIYTDTNSLGNSISCKVTGSTFGLYAPAFKPNYSGQTPHGQLPEVGLELNDLAAVTIGNNVTAQNTFYHLNSGITGFRSNITVNNSELYKIFIDTFYNKPYDGTALVSRGDISLHIPGTLTVNPPLAAGMPTVHDSYRGIYTNYSNLYVSFTKLITLNTGIWSRHCSDLSVTKVSDCYIEASRYGIDWRFNAGSLLMSAYENQIIMSNDTTGIAINMEESNTAGIANYQINGNFNIDVTSSRHGIRARNVFNPIIINNHIKQHSNGTYPKTWGITLFGTDSANVQCNVVDCQVLSYSQSLGMHVSESKISTIACNNFDSTATGMYFGGNCGGTDLKGNLMLKNISGLYLNFMAVISPQKHKGNKWINYTGPFGAVNINSGPIGLASSLFIVNDTMGTILYPYIPLPMDSGWFFIDPSGHAYECGTTCDVIHQFTDDELERLIAQGKKLTDDYIPESKDIANEYLFDRLYEDSVFLASDSIYGIFYNNQKNKPVGKLHDVKEDLYAISWYDSLFKSLTGIADSLIKIKQDSIYLIDSLNAISTLTNYDALRFNLTNGLNVLLQTRANLFIQRALFVDGKISDAATKNSAIVTTKLPDINRQFMNQMQVLFERYGEDSIAPYYSQILDIAQQCPYAGGPAVYVARTFVAMFDDDMDYDDDAVCLQSGIFRQENKNQLQTAPSEISIIPNPANDKITILINGTQEGICKIEISNTLGSVILKDEMNCKEKSHIINTRNFVSGVYFVKVHLNNSPLKTAKLIIER